MGLIRLTGFGQADFGQEEHEGHEEVGSSDKIPLPSSCIS
jgi:hypothetical protein